MQRRSFATTAWPKLLALGLATGLLARASFRAIYSKLGHPGGALDDAYIHFQYARAIAEGHPFRYQAGEPISTGGTSFVWPLVLSVPYALGARGESIVLVAWVLSFAALAGLAYETYALALPLAGRAGALGASAMVLAFGGLVWGAASGMEVVPFAWVMALAVRRASEWAEHPAARTKAAWQTALGLALLAPFVRPEGAIASLILASAVAIVPAPRKRRFVSALPIGAAMVAPNLLLLALTGHATASTAQVKLLPGNPYFPLAETAFENARTLVGTILNGEVWSAEFLPSGGAWAACLGLVAIVWRGARTERKFRAAAVVALALTMFVPCFYVTFLWNRLRYVWPFAPAWFVGLACLARVAATLVARLDARAGAVTTALLTGGVAGAFAMRLEGVIDDVAQSASGISRQQVALGHWVNEHLPVNARVGVNDTGAIAYFGNRRTFDIVGLTTPSEGRYWVAGAGSRLEHYERLHAASKASLPTHFVVYPNWMACTAVLGKPLHEAVVNDASILGGNLMRVYEARWDDLGSGERPWTPVGPIVDAVDVADLESEAEHRYELLGAHDGEQVAEESNAPDGSPVIDGGRTNRHRERFVVRLPKGRTARGIARVESEQDVVVHVAVGGTTVASHLVTAGRWTEFAFDIPAALTGEATTVDVASEDAPFASFHWWFANAALAPESDPGLRHSP